VTPSYSNRDLITAVGEGVEITLAKLNYADTVLIQLELKRNKEAACARTSAWK